VERHLSDSAFGVLDYSLRDAKQNLHLAFDPLDVVQQFAIKLALRERVDLANQLQHHARHIICHLRCSDMHEAGHQRVTNLRWVFAHLAGPFISGTSAQDVESFRLDAGYLFGCDANGT
jgi:hypothetical protein